MCFCLSDNKKINERVVQTIKIVKILLSDI